MFKKYNYTGIACKIVSHFLYASNFEVKSSTKIGQAYVHPLWYIITATTTAGVATCDTN